eukprot:5649539-Alexandrium_andersonii.AAC.1
MSASLVGSEMCIRDRLRGSELARSYELALRSGNRAESHCLQFVCALCCATSCILMHEPFR